MPNHCAAVLDGVASYCARACCAFSKLIPRGNASSMKQTGAEVVEWHILENANAKSSPVEHQAVHMGPFASEEECRAVLASLKLIPCFSHGNLEVHKKHRRREKRIRIKIAVRVSLLSCPEKTWDTHTVDVSTLGARLADCGEPLT